MFETKGLVKVYKSKKGQKVTALDHVDLQFEEKGVVFILGKSGSGKSTLLNVLGGLDSYDGGEIIIKGKSSKNFKARDFDSYRNTYVGFIFQDYNILEEFSVSKNLGIALQLQRKPADEIAIQALLEQVDLGGLGNRNPNELSGGQKQRVAIARALIKNPDIIMADEPTGNLDSKTGTQVFETLQKLGREKLVLVVSHDRESAEKYATRIIELSDGKVISDIKRTDNGFEGTIKGIKILDGKMVHIPHGHVLTNDDLETINRLLSTSKEDMVLTADPEIMNRVHDKAQPKKKGKFVPTSECDNNYQQYGPDDFKVIKSKLPYIDSFKMGATGLRAKKFRLVMTILLSVIAFTFFTLSDMLSSFDVAGNTVQTMYDNDFRVVSITRKDIKYVPGWDGEPYAIEIGANFSSADHELFANRYPTIDMFDRYEKAVFLPPLFHEITSGASMYYTDSTKGFLELDSFADLGLTSVPISGSYFPLTVTEIAITDYIADHFLKNGLKGTGAITSKEQLIGKSIAFFEQTYKITAIVDTGIDIETYKTILDTDNPWDVGDYRLAQKFSGLKDYLLSNIFVKKGFAEANFGTIDSINFEKTGGYIAGSLKSNSRGYVSVSELNKFENTLSIYTGALPAVTTLADDEILLSAEAVASSNMDDFYSRFEELQTSYRNAHGGVEPTGNTLLAIYNQAVRYAFDRLLSLNDNELVYVFEGNAIGFTDFIGTDIKAVGMVEATSLEARDAYRTEIILSVDFYDSVVDKINSPSAAYFKMSGNRLIDLSIFNFLEVKDHDGYRYYVQTPFSDELQTVRFLVENLSSVFFWISIVFASFSTLLMANFISMSITYKKKEIGILRAIGARSTDVFGIFFNESLIIAMIDFVITIILTIGITIFANISLKDSLGTSLTIFAFGFRQLFFLALICGGVAFIASLLPVRKIARMKPIDAIKNA